MSPTITIREAGGRFRVSLAGTTRAHAALRASLRDYFPTMYRQYSDVTHEWSFPLTGSVREQLDVWSHRSGARVVWQDDEQTQETA